MDGRDLHAEARTDIGAVDALPLVRLSGVTKRFGKVLANDAISLAILPGRIKALLGENGAGKSTLMAMLAGRFPPTRGASNWRAGRSASPRPARPSPRAWAWSTSISCSWRT